MRRLCNQTLTSTATADDGILADVFYRGNQDDSPCVVPTRVYGESYTSQTASIDKNDRKKMRGD